MTTITEKLADLQAQTVQWVAQLEAGVITFDKYREKLKAIQEETQAATGEIEKMGAASEKAANAGGGAAPSAQALFGPPVGWEDAAQKQTKQSLDYIDTLAKSSNKAAIDSFKQQKEDWIATQKKLLDESQSKLDAHLTTYQSLSDKAAQIRESLQGQENSADYEKRVEDLQFTMSKAAFFYRENIIPLQKVTDDYQATIDANQRQLDRLDQGVQAAGPAKTYEIKFATASGQSKTMTTTQNPEDFLAALEAAQRSAR